MPISSTIILQDCDKAHFNSFEQSIIHTLKTLPKNPWDSQDILQLINTCRKKSVNPGRISKNSYLKAPKVDQQTLTLYLDIQRQWNLKTGLNPYHHERLISAREAMIQAVQVFNNPSMHFKTQIFAVNSIIAWTYLVHEKYIRESMPIRKTDGKTRSLSSLISENIFGIDDAICANIEFIIEVRNNIEHEILGQVDTSLQSKFQACAVNFNTMLKQWFGECMDLADHLSFAVQFANLTSQQLNQLQMLELPPQIKAIDVNLAKKYAPEVFMSKSYDFTVYYGQTLGSRSTSGQKFFADGSQGDKAVNNIVLVPQPSAKTHPFVPTDVVKSVGRISKIRFTPRMHTNAWKKFNVRPSGSSQTPEKTDEQYCYYDTTYKRHSYNQKWIDFLVAEISEPAKLEALKNFRE